MQYEKARNQGHKIAQYNTAYLYKKSYKSEKAIKWYEKSANQGYRDAQYEMGIIYVNGLNPIKSDLNKAINWFEKATNQGHIESQNILGRLYKYQDPKKSFKWYEKAANQGSPEAEYEIGLFLLSRNYSKNKIRIKLYNFEESLHCSRSKCL